MPVLEFDDTHALGYAHNAPGAIASNTSDRHWPLKTLLKVDRPVPDAFWDPALVATAFNQNPEPSCVAFSAQTIRDAQEFKDWGAHLFKDGLMPGVPGGPTGGHLAYQWLKHGSPDGSYPGDGYNGDGSWPEAVCKLALKYGLPDKDGKPHKIGAYYAIRLESDADWAVVQQILLDPELGACQIGTPWPSNWFAAPSSPDYLRPYPGGPAGGHAYTLAGWKKVNGEWYVGMMNNWGPWGHPQGRFYFPVKWLYALPLGPQIVWKTVDIKDAIIPPTPPPGGPVLTLTDKIARLVDSTVGKTLWRADGVTKLVNISSGALNLASPAAYKDTAGALFYSVVISSGGLPQLAWIKATDCFNVRVQGTDAAALKLSFNEGVTAASTAALTAKKV